MSKFSLLSSLLLFIHSFMVAANSSNQDNVAKELANPTSALASLTFKYQIRQFDGDLPRSDQQQSNGVLFQPALPFPFENGDKIIARPGITYFTDTPIHDQASFSDKSGISDTSLDLLYAFKPNNGVTHAFGAYMTLPTGDEEIGQGESTTLGPEYYYVKMGQKSAFGVLLFQSFDIAGDVKVNTTSSQIFMVALPGGGWNYGSSPTISHDWENDQWTIPLNFSIGRTVKLAERPWKFAIELDYYVEKNDQFAPEWMISFRASPVVENVLASWFM